jgi:glycolate oxidase iron-sulfur subunit
MPERSPASSAERWSRLNATEIRELADDCVHCGFCLPACPTYVLWGREADSPRGRIYLMKAALGGRSQVDATFARHMDACLGCMGCLTACPSGVHYDRLIEATRPEVERSHRRTFGDRLFRALLFGTLPYPRRLRWIAAALRFAQRTGLQRALRTSGVLARLPARVAALERLAPAVEANDGVVKALTPAYGPAVARVGLLLGCVQRVFFSRVNAATARVLAADGCEVVAPPEQECCGALMLHAGRLDEARAAARRLIDVFDRARVEEIVVNAAGCGSAMKQYGDLLSDDPAYAERARAFALRTVDVSELLVRLGPRAVRHPLPLRVAYHDACHLNHAQRIRREPRQALQTIPQLELSDIAEPDLCCGSAGIYNLVEPEAAQALRDRKVRHVIDTGAAVLASSNPGCLLQIASGLEAAGRAIRTMHFVELLDESITNLQDRGRRSTTPADRTSASPTA